MRVLGGSSYFCAPVWIVTLTSGHLWIRCGGTLVPFSGRCHKDGWAFGASSDAWLARPHRCPVSGPLWFLPARTR